MKGPREIVAELEARHGDNWTISDARKVIASEDAKRERYVRHLHSNPSIVLMPWDPTDEPCVLCDEPHTPTGGIETTRGWLCYACAGWINAVAPELRALAEKGDWRRAVDETP